MILNIPKNDKQSLKNERNQKSTFQSLKDFLGENSDSPDEYLRKCRLEYEGRRKEIISNKTPLASSVKSFVENHRQFLFLDWQNLALELIAAKSKAVFYLFAFIKQMDILPKKDELKDIVAFQQYQDLISDKTTLREIFENDDALKTAKFSASAEWQTVEEKNDGKKFYALSVECGDYVMAADSDEKKNVLDVATDVCLLDGLSFKCALDNDEIIYLEVSNV